MDASIELSTSNEEKFGFIILVSITEPSNDANNINSHIDHIQVRGINSHLELLLCNWFIGV